MCFIPAEEVLHTERVTQKVNENVAQSVTQKVTQRINQRVRYFCSFQSEGLPWEVNTQGFAGFSSSGFYSSPCGVVHCILMKEEQRKMV